MEQIDKNKKWKEILEIANIEYDEQIATGLIESVKVSEQRLEWRLNLRFPTVLQWEKLENLMNQMKDYLIKTYELNNVHFHILPYEEELYDFKIILDYFYSGLKVCEKIKATVKMLEIYPISIEDDGLIIKVATEEDRDSVKETLPIVIRFLENYGFAKVNIDVVIDGEEINYRDVVRTKHRIEEQQFEAKLVENYQALKEKNKGEKESATFKPKYTQKQVIPIRLNEIPMTSIDVETFRQTRGSVKVSIEAVIVKSECTLIKSKNTNQEYNLFQATVTDYTDSVIVKRFYHDFDRIVFEKEAVAGKRALIEGSIQWDAFASDVIIMIDKITVYGDDTSRYRYDGAVEKRVELHAHTKLSVLDSILDVKEYVDTAKRYGHKALAVTDHANCHVMPEFFKAAKAAGLKPIAGSEAYFVDDENISITLTNESIELDNATYVIFDIETTGLFIPFHEIIEIGAVKVKNGLIVDEFSEFVKPKERISDFIANFTDISNETVADADVIENVLLRFKKFIDGTILVAHNAKFDTDFVYQQMREIGIFVHSYPCIDTLQLARALYGENLKHFNLGAVAKFLKVDIEQQHRAIHDARTANNVFMKMLGDLYSRGIHDYSHINDCLDKESVSQMMIPTHLNMLVKNREGLKNFYKIISDANTTHFTKEARVLKSVLDKYREGLLIGSGCVNGDVFTTAIEKTYDALLEKMDYYDYIEVQPPVCYLHLFEKTKEPDALDRIKKVIETIIRAAKQKNKIVVATGDVHHLIAEDSKYRNIYLSVARPNGGGPHQLANYSPIDMHFRSTTEMLEEFNFLPADLAYEIVVTNTNLIADQIEEYEIFPSKLFFPRDDFLSSYGVPSMKEAVRNVSFSTCHALYGENLPEYVNQRLQVELDKIIGNGFSSVYYISYLLVKNSNEAGYVVGSRGSVGSSFVATMMKITEVNPLKPHYRCPKCRYSAFKYNDAEKEKYHVEIDPEIDELLQHVDVGLDLPPHKCPVCGANLIGDGVDIAFETFLGFNGEKVPDIDLNFSGEYQAKAHTFVQKIFGVDGAFRAGTISTVKQKTAFVYVRDYYKKMDQNIRKSEMERIATFIEGAKRTTGQHPGGIVVVPDEIEYTDIIPVQYPPVGDPDIVGDLKWRTSHYDYHSFESNLLKLDILGHDDPTLIKVLMDYVKNEPDVFPFKTVEEIPYVDNKVLSLFSSKEVLGLQSSDGDVLSSGTIGIPEFGTTFVRNMLEVIKPKTCSDIIKVSGLAHGTNVWASNAEDLFKGSIPEFPSVPFSEVIGCRDDIMLYLINCNLPAHDAFTIMESVRKGKGLKTSQEELMRSCGVPEWYIYSCKKIKYMFPKAHATAYVIMALRIGWFKVHRPIYYYAAYFSKRAKELDCEVFAMGKNAIRNRINDIETRTARKQEVSNKEKDLLNELKIALEMTLRGFVFRQIDIEKSLATDFVIAEDKKSLYLPFVAIDSLGEAVANSIIEARDKSPFSSKKDFETRTSINKTQYAKLRSLGVLDNLPDNETLL